MGKNFTTITSGLTMDMLAIPLQLIIADYGDACFLLSKYKTDAMAMTSVAIIKDS
jgi:hypothetical protein